MTASICNHELKNEYEHAMLQCVRCELHYELKECKTCKTNKNKLKKANNIFPDAIVDLINSFNACKRCIKTIDIIKNEPNEMNIEEANLWYFVNLNPLPSMTSLNKQLSEIYQLERCTRSSWRFGDLNFYHYYQDWFNKLWEPQTVSRLTMATMLNILRIMFSLNGKKYKLEYPNIFNEEFMRDNVYNCLLRTTNVRNYEIRNTTT